MSNWNKGKVCKKYVMTSRGQRICASYGQGYSLQRQKKSSSVAPKKYVSPGGILMSMIAAFRRRY